MAGQRRDYLTWDEYFMSLTSLATLRSKNFSKGACIINKEHRILSVGYEEVPCTILQNEEADLSSFATDSLSNAIYNFKGRRQELEGGTVYLTSFPNCTESRHIAQAGLYKVIYLMKDVPEDVEYISRKILDCAGVEVIPYYDTVYSFLDYKDFLKELKQTIRFHIGKVESGSLLLDEYFMSVAVLSALRSKDPSTQVGACLVDAHNQILSISYNGTPRGMSDDVLPWDSPGEKTGDLITTKNPYIVHAEINAFDNYRGNQDDLKKAKLYLLYSPCDECSKVISKIGLDQILYLRTYRDTSTYKLSYKWLSKAKIMSTLYNDEHDYTKEECVNLLKDTTKVIKKSLGK